MKQQNQDNHCTNCGKEIKGLGVMSPTLEKKKRNRCLRCTREDDGQLSNCCHAELLTVNGDEGTSFWQCSKCKKAADPVGQENHFGDVPKMVEWESKFWKLVESDGVGSDIRFCQKVRDLILKSHAAGKAEGCKHKESDPSCPCWLDGFQTSEAENGFNAKHNAQEAFEKGKAEGRRETAEQSYKTQDKFLEHYLTFCRQLIGMCSRQGKEVDWEPKAIENIKSLCIKTLKAAQMNKDVPELNIF